MFISVVNLTFSYLANQAVAYYYHGLVIDKGGEPASHISAVCCLSAADDLLSEGKRACLSFCLANPVTRSDTTPRGLAIRIHWNASADKFCLNSIVCRIPPPWGVMKNMHKKIPDVAYKKFQVYGHLFEKDKNRYIPWFQDNSTPEMINCKVWELLDDNLSLSFMYTLHFFAKRWFHYFFCAARFNRFLIYQSLPCHWDRKGTSCQALIQSGRMLMANLKFRAWRSIWSMMKTK